MFAIVAPNTLRLEVFRSVQPHGHGTEKPFLEDDEHFRHVFRLIPYIPYAREVNRGLSVQ